jgi:hypothetical protein
MFTPKQSLLYQYPVDFKSCLLDLILWVCMVWPLDVIASDVVGDLLLPINKWKFSVNQFFCF